MLSGTSYRERRKMPLKRKFRKILQYNTKMKVDLTKRKVAQIAQALTTYKLNNPTSLTPMRDMYMESVQNGMRLDEPMYREQHLRVARLLGWSVTRVGDKVYENGTLIWHTAGN